MSDHARSLRAIAQMLDDETSVDTTVTAIKALEVVIDKLGGSTRPVYGTPPHGVLAEWATRPDNQPPQTWWDGQTDPWSLEPASP